MTTSRITPSKWMYTDGTDLTEDKIIKKPGGFYKVNKKGLLELIHCLSTLGDVAPTILSVTNQIDGDYAPSAVLSFSLVFSEVVTVTTTGGTPSIQVYTEAGTLIDIPYASGTGTDTLVFSGATTGIADGTLLVDLIMDDNGGDVEDSAGNNVDPRFPENYVQPTITITTI